MLRVLFATTLAMAFGVIVLGSYVRLRNAGLGCPDWPGCYGQLLGVPTASANEVGPEGLAKAWIEVSHRYLAASLGLLILVLTALVWNTKSALAWRWPVVLLLLLVIGQGLLGALTVTTRLQPAVVVVHLLGGILILSLLATGYTRLFQRPKSICPAGTILFTSIAFAGTLVQLVLGGIVSANYAASACGRDFPSCNGSFTPPFDSSALAFDRSLGHDASDRPLSSAALVSVHWLHRLGALMLSLLVSVSIVALWRSTWRLAAVVLSLLLLAQLTAGIAMINGLSELLWPLLHNAGAALLCAFLAATLTHTWQARLHQQAP